VKKEAGLWSCSTSKWLVAAPAARFSGSGGVVLGGVARLDCARGKKHVWISRVQT